MIVTRNTQTISGLIYAMFICGLAMWLVYGVLIDDLAISLANLLTLLFTLPILVIKCRVRLAGGQGCLLVLHGFTLQKGTANADGIAMAVTIDDVQSAQTPNFVMRQLHRR